MDGQFPRNPAGGTSHSLPRSISSVAAHVEFVHRALVPSAQHATQCVPQAGWFFIRSLLAGFDRSLTSQRLVGRAGAVAGHLDAMRQTFGRVLDEAAALARERSWQPLAGGLKDLNGRGNVLNFVWPSAPKCGCVRLCADFGKTRVSPTTMGWRSSKAGCKPALRRRCLAHLSACGATATRVKPLKTR